MLFNSIEYFIFLPIVVLGYWLLPRRSKWIPLLLASYFFYMYWNAGFIVLILVSTLVDYFVALRIASAKLEKIKKFLLAISLTVNLGLLVVFKYLDFLAASLNKIFEFANSGMSVPLLHLLLPVGISFYTFQTLGYTIDVYRGRVEAEKHFGLFALYVSFFPQLVAGPIERAGNLLPQLKNAKRFDIENASTGVKLIVWGLFKKMVIADRLALFVDFVYNNPSYHGGLSVMVATFFFAFQIYCDFSGYTDIAIGSAKLLNINLMENFKLPYFSKSVSEFWQRWHISLSSWFKEYLYIPLGGNRVKLARWQFNILVVFLLSGIWHGAKWTFVIWGALHAFYLIAERLLSLHKKMVSGFARYLKIIMTFVLVCFAWIFFRANSTNDAFYLIRSIFTKDDFTIFAYQPYHFKIAISAIAVLLLVQILQRKTKMIALLQAQPILLRFTAYLAIVFLILIFGFTEQNDFIYFQF